jgi:hypothetical protein
MGQLPDLRKLRQQSFSPSRVGGRLRREISVGGLRKYNALDGLQVDARILPAPALRYRSYMRPPQNGVWNMVGKEFLAGAQLESYAIVSFKPEKWMGQPGAPGSAKVSCKSDGSLVGAIVDRNLPSAFS